MYTAILQNPDYSTVLSDVINEANFSKIVYRTPRPSASIIVEDGVYVEIDGNSRKVLFPVRSASA